MVRVDDSGGEVQCWLRQDELDELEAVALEADWQRDIAMQLMARCGFRASEVPYSGDAQLRWSEPGDCWLVETRGKNTKGGEKALRDAWMPEDVASSIHRYSRERGLDDEEPWFDVSVDPVRRWVKNTAEELADRTGDERWLQVSSHDLRRSWATYHLVERGVDVRTMMSIGGWSNYSAIEPYLDEPTEGRIGSVMKEAA